MPALLGFVGLSLLAATAPLPTRLPGLALFAVSGVAAWLVWRRLDVGLERKRRALRWWGWQVLLAGLFPGALFGMHSGALAACGLVALAGAAGSTLLQFRRVRPGAALLLLPYIVYVICAESWALSRFWPGAT